MDKLIALSLLCAVFMGVSARAQTQDRSGIQRDTVKRTSAVGKKAVTNEGCGKLEGKVTDGHTGVPISAVTINLLSDKWVKDHNKHARAIAMAVPDSTGLYQVDGIPAGVYCAQIACADTGYQAYTYTNVKIRRSLITTVDFRLSRKKDLPPGLGPIYGSMVHPDETSTIRRWSEEEINKLPGH
jgi:hypothetical protein